MLHLSAGDRDHVRERHAQRCQCGEDNGVVMHGRQFVKSAAHATLNHDFCPATMYALVHNTGKLCRFAIIALVSSRSQ